MKFANKILIALSALSGVSAFTPNAFNSRATRLNTGLASVVTGPGGKAATSKEEDIALTLAIIMAHDVRSVTVTAEQNASQNNAAVAADEIGEAVDLSIPYDAAAQLAYDASDKSMAYADFKTKYEADAVALVKSKQPIDISIPYDAAAKLAFEASDKSMAYADFKTKYEADAVAYVIAK
jgi:hypothetical protein